MVLDLRSVLLSGPVILISSIVGAFMVAWLLIWFFVFPMFVTPVSARKVQVAGEAPLPARPKDKDEPVIKYTLECDESNKCRNVHVGRNTMCDGRELGVPFRCTPPGSTKEVDGCRCDKVKK